MTTSKAGLHKRAVLGQSRWRLDGAVRCLRDHLKISCPPQRPVPTPKGPWRPPSPLPRVRLTWKSFLLSPAANSRSSQGQCKWANEGKQMTGILKRWTDFSRPGSRTAQCMKAFEATVVFTSQGLLIPCMAQADPESTERRWRNKRVALQWRNLTNYLSQMIKININSDQSYWKYVYLAWREKNGTLPLWSFSPNP